MFSVVETKCRKAHDQIVEVFDNSEAVMVKLLQTIIDAYSPCPGGLLVVMNRNINIQSIDDLELRRLFLGKSRRLPNGARAALASFGPETTFFNERLLGLSDAEVATIWSRLRFSGRTPPPRTFDTAEEVLAFVESRANALAYIPSCIASDSVRVFSSLPR